MAARKDLFTFTIAKYEETINCFINTLGLGRYSINIFKISFIFEFWTMRRK